MDEFIQWDHSTSTILITINHNTYFYISYRNNNSKDLASQALVEIRKISNPDIIPDVLRKIAKLSIFPTIAAEHLIWYFSNEIDGIMYHFLYIEKEWKVWTPEMQRLRIHGWFPNRKQIPLVELIQIL